nr:MAG TPA: hypothetical protein [Caudoviricetes sp.]
MYLSNLIVVIRYVLYNCTIICAINNNFRTI